MEHKGTVKLETDRLILRKVTMADAQDMFDNWASNPNVTKFMTWPTHSNIEITKMVLSNWVNSYENFTYYQWGIVIKKTNQLIGTISVVRFKEEINEVEIGYCIGEKWWNQGITSEALKEVIRFFFEEVKANRICACHDINNPNSGKVMIKCNMKYEGTLRQAVRRGTGKLSDLSYYSILKEEYK